MKKNPTNQKDTAATGLTLAEYAKEKRLHVDFLKSLGLTEFHLQRTPVVHIPYLDADQQVVAARFRLSMKTEPRFQWKRGSKPMPYGLWRLDAARKAGNITIVEGESDAQTLWLHNVPALGIPGAKTWKEEWAAYFEGIETIYVVIEPDKGGDAVLKWLARSAIRDRVRLIKLDEAKDPSGLYLKNPKTFRNKWDKAVAVAQPWSEIAEAESKAKLQALWQECKDVATEENILASFAKALVQRGAAGVSRRAKILYLALTSRLLDRIVSVGIKGPSSAGKSYLVDSVLAFFPPEAYYRLTAMSDKALAYSDEPLSHRFVVLCEAAALGSEWAAYFVRSLMSEGRLVYETVEKTPDGMRSRRIEREGPTGLVTTTTHVSLHPENETRYFSLPVDDGQEQTRLIMESEAHKISGMGEEPISEEVFFRPWLALQQWLQSAEHRVVVPFAPAIANLIPPVAVRLRRDFPAVMGMVKAHALLHQATRDRDNKGRIVADLGADYGHVWEIVHKLVAQAAEQVIPKAVRETVRAVEEICGPVDERPNDASASIKQIANALKLDRSAASRRVRDCLERGFLETTEPPKRGKQMKLVPGEPLPEDESLLPTVEEVGQQVEIAAD